MDILNKSRERMVNLTNKRAWLTLSYQSI